MRLRSTRRRFVCQSLFFGWLTVSAAFADETPLAWDAVEKTYVAKAGEADANVAFTVTNRTDRAVTITGIATSCHCTAAQPPRSPWVLAPGASDALRVTVDLRGKSGELTKTIYVYKSVGGDAPDILLVHVQIPLTPAELREMNRGLALADRQAVLRGDCASCHVAPTVGKMGKELFQTACLICHGGEHRASMVPDLTVAKVRRDAAYWNKTIREGKEKTLMPAFAKNHDGSLDDNQIKSLVEYLVANLPAGPTVK